AKGWAQGAFDLSLQPKPVAYLLKSMFSDEPVVHIGIVESEEDRMWNGVQTGVARMNDHWNHKVDEVLSLYTYTNGDEVELFINGKSQGVKKNVPGRGQNKLKWDGVKYVPGYIEAIARKDGKIVARHRIETADKVKKLIVEPDHNNWRADGTDLQHLRVYAVDSKGRRVPNVNSHLSFRVEGDAAIVGVDNGNIVSHELHAISERDLFHGSALVILRAGHTPGEITLITECDDFKTVKTKLQTK
ncbi:MAG: DUF4982 domain-containing protein, partial [Bacteroidaceae bacterium]|nr:DUF4982 domain-containing protein [Bacteroidaceae bacterium]